MEKIHACQPQMRVEGKQQIWLLASEPWIHKNQQNQYIHNLQYSICKRNFPTS